MNQEEFIKFIKSIGFDYKFGNVYNKGIEYTIYLYLDYYSLFNSSERIISNSYSDLTPIENHFKNELRSIKLKKILG